MKVEIVDLSSCKKQINVELPADKVGEQFNRVSYMIAQNANIPGFRRGRAPLSVVKNRFRKEIRDQVMRDLLPDLLRNAVIDNQLAVIGEPSIDELKLDEGQPLVFKAKVEVLPNIELKEYRGLKATKKLRIITDEMVNKRIDELREQHSTLVPVEDREVRDGDFVTIDLKGKYLDQTAEDLSSDGIQVEVGSKDLQPEFTENVRGMKSGETRSFKVNYPQDFHNAMLAGHEIEYTVTVQSVKVKELPELDDEFAQGLGDYESLEDLKKKTRDQLEGAANREADERFRTALLDQLLEAHPFDVPDVLIEGQMNERLQNLAQMLMNQGMDPRGMNLDWASMRTAQRAAAINDVRRALIVEKIAQTEKLDISETDMEEEITRISAALGMSLEATKSRLTKEEAIDSIKNRLRNKKALDLIVSNAEAVEERVSSEELDRHDHAHDHEHEHNHEGEHEHHHHEHHEGCEHDHGHEHGEAK